MPRFEQVPSSHEGKSREELESELEEAKDMQKELMEAGVDQSKVEKRSQQIAALQAQLEKLDQEVEDKEETGDAYEELSKIEGYEEEGKAGAQRAELRAKAARAEKAETESELEDLEEEEGLPRRDFSDDELDEWYDEWEAKPDSELEKKRNELERRIENRKRTGASRGLLEMEKEHEAILRLLESEEEQAA